MFQARVRERVGQIYAMLDEGVDEALASRNGHH